MLSAAEQRQSAAANASGKPTVFFIHGLWLLAGSWDAWRELFEANGYATVAGDWPDDPASVEEARANPQVFAGKSIKQVADHLDEHRHEPVGGVGRTPVGRGHRRRQRVKRAVDQAVPVDDGDRAA